MSTPSDEALQPDVTEAPPAGVQPAVAGPAPRPPARPKGDPIARLLWLGIAVVIILALVTVAFSLLTNVLGTGAPRTMAEYKLSATRAKIDAGSKERQDWMNYILALTDDGQYQVAQDWIDRGKRTLKSQDISADMVYMQANLYAAQGKLDLALKTADTGLNTIQKTHDKAVVEWKRTGVPTEASIGLSENFWEMLLLKAEVYEQKKDWKGAKSAYDRYLAEKKTAATVFAQRAAVKEQLKDVKGAAADYRTTLRFIPDNADALAGLKRIGAAK